MSLEDEAQQSAHRENAIAAQVLREGQELAALFAKHGIPHVTFDGGATGWVLKRADRAAGPEGSGSWYDGVAVLANGEIREYYYHRSSALRGLAYDGHVTDARYHQLLVGIAKAILSGSYQTPDYESSELDRHVRNKKTMIIVAIVFATVAIICIAGLSGAFG